MALHPHGIAPTFFTLDSWSPGACLIPIICIQLDKEINFVRKKISLMHTKRYKTHFRKCGQSRVGAILRLTVLRG